MIKVTLGEIDRLRVSNIDRSGSALTHLRLTGAETSIVDRLQIRRLVEALELAVADYEKYLRALVADCGGRPDKDDPARTTFPPDRVVEFNDKRAKLHQTVVEVCVMPLPLSALERAPLTVDDLNALQKFYVEKSDPPENDPTRLRAV